MTPPLARLVTEDLRPGDDERGEAWIPGRELGQQIGPGTAACIGRLGLELALDALPTSEGGPLAGPDPRAILPSAARVGLRELRRILLQSGESDRPGRPAAESDRGAGRIWDTQDVGLGDGSNPQTSRSPRAVSPPFWTLRSP